MGDDNSRIDGPIGHDGCSVDSNLAAVSVTIEGSKFEGAAPYLEAAVVNFVIVAKTPLERLLTFARESGNLRFLSAAIRVSE